MNDYITYLSALLEKEIATFRLLLESLEAEQQALVQHDINTLEEVVETQKALTLRAADQEKDRIRIIRQMASILQESSETLTLGRVIELVDAPQAEQLQELREELLALQENLRKANRHNSLLLRQSMKYVDKSLQILTGSGPSGNVYGRPGKAPQSTPALQGVVNQIV